jgi:hypothetical protein
MKLPRNPKLSVKGRELLVERIEDAVRVCWIALQRPGSWRTAPTNAGSR